MEDAHISQSPITDKKNSLFAVFDGHGGIILIYLIRPRSIDFCRKTLYRLTLS